MVSAEDSYPSDLGSIPSAANLKYVLMPSSTMAVRSPVKTRVTGSSPVWAAILKEH